MNTTLKDRLTSRKFLLTMGAILGAVSAGLTGALTWPQVMQAVVVAIVPFILGQSYVEGKIAEFVPPDVQEKMIESAALALFNAFLARKQVGTDTFATPPVQVTAAISPTVTQTNPIVVLEQARNLGIFAQAVAVEPTAIEPTAVETPAVSVKANIADMFDSLGDDAKVRATEFLQNEARAELVQAATRG